jgi:predicted Zn-dependent protease
MTPQHLTHGVAASAVIALTARLSGVVAQSPAHQGSVDDEEQIGQEVFN